MHIMSLILTFVISLLMTKVIIYISDTHSQIVLDSDTSGIQKMHDHVVPRVGGVAIFVSLVFIALYGSSLDQSWEQFYCGSISATFFVFLGGLTEDLSKAVSPRVRILFTAVAVAFAIYATHVMPLLKHLGHVNLDQLLVYDTVAFVITAFAVIGISNSFNIIDGYNGLSTMTAISSLSAIAYLAHQFGDDQTVFLALSLIAAILGFFVFNYPKGKIFLGDGGAYTIGFLVSLLALNLVESHIGQISPYAALLVVIYPFTETVFSIFRRKFIHKTKSTEPDNLHLHQLVFDRAVRKDFSLKERNSFVMPLMSMFYLPPVIMTLLFYKSTTLILASIVLYIIFYVYCYFRLIHFKTLLYLKLKAKLIMSIYKSVAK